MNPSYRSLLIILGLFTCLSNYASKTCAADAETMKEDVKEGEDIEEAVPESVGVELGEFFIRDVRGSEGVKTRVSFTLYADIPFEEEESFRALQKTYEQRIRDHIILSIRLCDTSKFQEPTLHTLKRRIWVRLHRMIPGFKIKGLMFKDFAYFND